MTNIIAIMGKKNSGKSEASRHLELTHGFKRISFADPIKCMLLSLGLSSEELWGGRKEDPSELLGGQTPRQAMQILGTEWGRNLIHKDIWTSAWKIQVSKYSKAVVVDDLRFLNEAQAVKELGGRIILIERAEIVSKDMHSSEVEFEKIPHDIKVLNNSSISNLRLEITKLLRIQQDDIVKRHKEILDLPARDWEPKQKRAVACAGISKLNYKE